MKILIVDDEIIARKRLKEMLLEIENEVEIEEAVNGKEALETIIRFSPEIVFLDIEMPVMSGLELLKKIETKPVIIFTTAYDQYAIEAFENDAVDYLLKPFGKDRLQKALHKAREKLQKSPDMERFFNIISKLQKDRTIQKLKIKEGDRIFFLDYDQIYYFSAEEKYTVVHSQKGEFIIDDSLNSLEKILPGDTFFRIHRNTLINLNYLQEIRKWFNGQYVAILKNNPDHPLPISRRKAQKLLHLS
jgi:DNA-binding LytR/AlgR family response regulator